MVSLVGSANVSQHIPGGRHLGRPITGFTDVVDNHTTLGKNNTIFPFASIGAVPQDLKFSGEPARLIVGDNNTIREFTLFNPGTEGGGSVTRVGDNNLFMGYVHLGHDVIIGNNCILANAATLAGHVEMGNNAVIGGMTPVHQFVKIGDFAMVGGASALSQDVPPYCMAEGNRATLRGLNLTGLRRHAERGAREQGGEQEGGKARKGEQTCKRNSDARKRASAAMRRKLRKNGSY